MGWALLFSGQGHQHPAMLPWLAPDDILADLDTRLGTDWRSVLNQPALAGRNRHAQLLLTGTACAAWSQLRARLGPPAIVAGYSVGELAAFAAAGACDATTALALAERRAACMDAAAATAPPTGLMGASGLPAGAIEALCMRFDLDVAIQTDAGSAVLGGLRTDLQAAADAAAGQGWRCVPLNVALASHTRWMRDAVPPFTTALQSTPMQAPARPLVSNVLGRVRSADAARQALARQIAETVRWDHCLDAVAAHQVQAVLEIGAGSALARMWNERHPDAPARSADEFRSVSAIETWLGRHAGA